MNVHVATVTVVFSGPATPAEIAGALMAQPAVVTVRVGAHGRPSVFRADVALDDDEAVTDAAAAVVREVAATLGANATVTSVAVVAEPARPEDPPAGLPRD